MNWLKGIRLAFAFPLILCATYPPALRAQVSGATLSGIVTDPQGASVANASVSVRNPATGVSTNTPTNSAGAYLAPNLFPVEYPSSVSHPRFSTSVADTTLPVRAEQDLH